MNLSGTNNSPEGQKFSSSHSPDICSRTQCPVRLGSAMSALEAGEVQSSSQSDNADGKIEASLPGRTLQKLIGKSESSHLKTHPRSLANENTTASAPERVSQQSMMSCSRHIVACPFLTFQPNPVTSLQESKVWHIKATHVLLRGVLDVLAESDADREKVKNVSIELGRFDVLRELLMHSKASDTTPIHLRKDQRGETLLFQACSVGNLGLVRTLLQFDASDEHLIQYSMDKHGWTPLMQASCHGYLEVVNELLEANLSEIHLLAKNHFGFTALMYACSRAHLHIVEKLLDADSSGKLVLAQNLGGWTSLMLASSSGNLQMVKQLLKANASENHLLAKNENDWTALMLASFDGRLGVVKELLHASASEEHVLAQSENGWTALMWASRSGHKHTVEALLDCNTSTQHLTMKDINGRTAADFATLEKHDDVAMLLQTTLQQQKQSMYE